MNLHRLLSLALGVAVSFNSAQGLAQSPAAAKIDGDSISVAEVRQELGVALGEKTISPQERPVLEAQTLGLLVNRYLVLKYMEKNVLGASKDDVRLSIDEFRKQLAAQQRTLDDHLRQLGFTTAELERLFAWQIGWSQYLSKKLTAENIEKYFKSSQRDFDGTKLVVRHILLKVENTASQKQVSEAVGRMLAIREEVTSGKTTFTEAAKKYSQGATAAQGGELGEIGRHAPMPASFNDAAFALKPGEISPPVMTHFGVHLVECVKEIPGTLGLNDEDVRNSVRHELIRYLFKVMADRERAGRKIEFTGALPYLKPDTQELVIPANYTATVSPPAGPRPARESKPAAESKTSGGTK